MDLKNLKKGFLEKAKSINPSFEFNDLKENKQNSEKSFLKHIQDSDPENKNFFIKEPSSELVFSLEKEHFSFEELVSLLKSEFISANFFGEKTLILSPESKNVVLDLRLEKNSSLNLTLFFEENVSSLFLVSNIDVGAKLNIRCFSKNKFLVRKKVVCEESAVFDSFVFSSFSDSKSNILLKESAKCFINNRFFSNEKNNVEDVVIHQGRDSVSFLEARGFVNGAFANVKGLIRIEKNAFNAKGSQSSRILNDGESKVVSIPDLEILNNDVKCSHSSSISKIKEDELFYFESRGISRESAKAVIVKGFLTQKILDDELSFMNNFLDEVLF